MRRRRFGGCWWVALILVGLFVGCGDTSTCENQREGVPALYPENFQFGTYWIGTLGIEELMVVGANATHTTAVGATFRDFTNYSVQLANRYDYPNSTCFIYLSDPVSSGTKEPLNVTSVSVKGLVGGDRAITPNGTNPDIDGRAYDADQVSFVVESGMGAQDYPGFEDQINAPVFPALVRLGSFGLSDLATGPSLGITYDRMDPLNVQWKPSQADYMEIVIIPNTGTLTGYAKVRCLSFDDGCLDVPAEALVDLAQDEATNFRFRLERHNFKLHTITEGENTKAVALIDVSAALEAIVVK